MRLVDFVFPFGRAAWAYLVVRPYRVIKSWWWKRNHPLEYKILKAFVKAYEAHIEEQGGLFPDLATDWDLRNKARLYGSMAMTEPPRSKVWITDVS